MRCVRNKAGQFAARLHKAMKGLGTDDNTLLRICINRSEIDMVQIKEQFQSAFGDPLGKWIKVCTYNNDFIKTLQIKLIWIQYLLASLYMDFLLFFKW